VVLGRDPVQGTGCRAHHRSQRARLSGCDRADPKSRRQRHFLLFSAPLAPIRGALRAGERPGPLTQGEGTRSDEVRWPRPRFPFDDPPSPLCDESQAVPAWQAGMVRRGRGAHNTDSTSAGWPRVVQRASPLRRARLDPSSQNALPPRQRSGASRPRGSRRGRRADDHPGADPKGTIP
jgi:hypothetical protein